MSASSSLATGVSRTNSRSLRNTFVGTSCELSARTLLKTTNVARCSRARSTIPKALFYMCHLLKTCHGIPAQQKGLWNCLSRTPCMLVRYCDILHARAAGVLRGTRSLSSYLYVFASSQGATCQPRRATILRSQGSASSIVKTRLMGLTELEYLFQVGCLALNCLLDCDDARMTYSCALNLRFGLGDETLVYFPRRNS